MKKYPIKFLDSYDREDRGIFFGRDEEINALYDMVFQSSVMLVYGASGAGKTSLINCGLAGKFQPHDWLALMIRRGNNINDSLEKALHDAGGNLSAQALDTNWHDEWSDESEKTATALSPVGRAIKAVYQKSFRPVYLIFDQFEELFILGSLQEQEIFIKTVQEILTSEQPVKLIFCIREEYLGHLFEFERAVPQLLRKKLRIEPMNLEKVKQVIIGVAEFEDSNISLKPGESDQVAEGIFDKIKGKGKTLTIQLPFLQVFLDKFYLKITCDESRTAEAEFNIDALNDMGEIGDILIDFLEEQVTHISTHLKGKYPALGTDTVWKILSPFSTLEGTREPIGKNALYDRLPDYERAMIDEVVDAFINRRILRYNEAMDMFEIAHDSLAKPIAEKRSVEETAMLEIKRLINSQVAVKEEAREYFTEKQLLFIEPYLHKFKVSEEEQAWIAESRANIQAEKEREEKKQKAELIRTRKRLRIVYSLLVVALVALVAAGFFGVIANKARITAKEASIEAKKQADTALMAQNEAEKLRKIADSSNQRLQEFLKTRIGADYQGGIVFYWDDKTGKHGLIAAENDLPGLYTWEEAKAKCDSFSVTVEGVKYDKWRLPKRKELNILYVNKSVVGGFSASNDNIYYWSSTEDIYNNSWPFSQYFYNGAYTSKISKGKKLRVRPIREF